MSTLSDSSFSNPLSNTRLNALWRLVGFTFPSHSSFKLQVSSYIFKVRLMLIFNERVQASCAYLPKCVWVSVLVGKLDSSIIKQPNRKGSSGK